MVFDTDFILDDSFIHIIILRQLTFEHYDLSIFCLIGSANVRNIRQLWGAKHSDKILLKQYGLQIDIDKSIFF